MADIDAMTRRKAYGSRAGATLALGLAAAAMAALPASAPAAPGPLKGVFVRTAQASVGPLSVVSADAYCPKGAPLVGGGFDVTAPGQNGPFPIESYRIKGRAWRATAGAGASPVPNPPPSTVTSYALCQRGARKLLPVVAGSQVPLLDQPASGAVEVNTNCPGRLRSVAGGFRGEADPASGAVLPQASEKSSKAGWRTSAIHLGNPSGKSQRALTSIGYCSKNGRTVNSQAAAVILPPPDLAGAATGSCPRWLQTGGFSASPVTPASAVIVLSSRPQGRSWLLRATNLFGGDPGTITASAYCRRR